MLFIFLGRHCTIENHCNLFARRHTVEYSDIDPNSFCIPIQHSTRRTYSYYCVVDDTAFPSIPISNLCTHGACKHPLYCPLTAFCMTLISSGESCCTTAEKLPVFRAAHSLKNVIKCVYHHPASVIALQHHRATTTLETYPHVHGRDGVALEVLIVVLSERVVIVKRHAAGPEHLRQERELVRLEALVQLLFLGPLLVLA